MSDKEKHIENYPIHDPEDESQGMKLVDKEKEKTANLKPGEYKYVSFEDWLKQANTFAGKHDFKFNDDGSQVDESSYPQGSSFGGSRTGSAKRSSYMQPGRGKTTTGSEGSMKSAGFSNPFEDLDVQSIKEQLGPDIVSKLEQISDIIDMDVNEIIKGAMNESGKRRMTVQEMLERLINMYL